MIQTFYSLWDILWVPLEALQEAAASICHQLAVVFSFVFIKLLLGSPQGPTVCSNNLSTIHMGADYASVYWVGEEWPPPPPSSLLPLRLDHQTKSHGRCWDDSLLIMATVIHELSMWSTQSADEMHACVSSAFKHILCLNCCFFYSHFIPQKNMNFNVRHKT